MSKSPFGLSADEDKVLYYWAKGKSKIDAYKAVMLTQHERDNLSETAIRKRVARLFGTVRMREAMESVERKVSNEDEEFQEWMNRKKEEMSRTLDPELARLKKKVRKEIENSAAGNHSSVRYTDEVEGADYPQDQQVDNDDESVVAEGERLINKMMTKRRLEELEKEANNAVAKTDNAKQKWLASLQVNENPSALTIYGTGQFLTYIAVKEMFDRQAEIKRQNISVLSKDGSVLTPNIISAIKTAAAMIIPYAPAPTEYDRREMSKAAVLLGLLPENIRENPEDYAAPPPIVIDVNKDSEQ